MTPATLIAALERTCTILDSSEEPLLAARSPSEIAADLRGAIALLQRGEVPDLAMIRVEFAPTGDVQDRDGEQVARRVHDARRDR